MSSLKTWPRKKKFDEIVGDGQYFHNETGKGNVVNNDMNITEAIEALDKAVDNAATEAGKHRTVSAGNGIKVEKTEATDDKEADITYPWPTTLP